MTLGPWAIALTAALALLGLGLVCAVIATALLDLWHETRGDSRPFRLALIAAALVLVAAAFAGVTVLILATVLT